jgi:hypothetical protein
MSLKKKLDKATYDALSTEIKSFYSEKDGSYHLDIDDDDDNNAALKRAKDREKQARKEAEEKLKKLQGQFDELMGNDAKKRGDIAALEKAWNDKLTKEVTEREAKIVKSNKYIERLLVDNVATTLAAKISIAPDLLLPHIRARLKADLESDEPTTVVLDEKGTPTKFTLTDLEKEISGDKRFASVIIGSKASGSSNPPSGGKTTLHGSSDSKPVDLRKLSAKELGARYAPEGYKPQS